MMSHKNWIQKVFRYQNVELSRFSVRSPKDGKQLGLERGTFPQVRNIIFPDQNTGVRGQYSK